MNAIAFRQNISKLLIDARNVNWSTDDCDDLNEEYSDSVPSPSEIRRRCSEIQKEWSAHERTKRSGIFAQRETWMPPTVSVCDME